MKRQEQFEADRFDQLEAWLENGTQPNQVTDEEMADLLRINQLLSQSHPVVPMPNAETFRHGILSKVRRKRVVFRLATAGAAIAATILMALLFFQKTPPVGDPDGPRIVLDQNLLEHAIQNQAKESMLAYLQDTEHLLLAMRDFDVHCADDQLDLAAEKKRAQDLLLQQKLFSTQINHPQFSQARQLFDQLERILVDVNGMEPCSDPTEVDFINRHINDNRILSKLRLIAQEIQV